MKFKLPHESLDASEFDFALLERMTQMKHRLAFECYAEISEEMFSGVPIFRRDAFDASFFHHLSSCTVEEAYNRSKNYLVDEPAMPIQVDHGAQAAVGIIRFIQGKGETPLPSLNAVTAKWFNLPSTAFDDPKNYEVFCRFLINLVKSLPACKPKESFGPLQPWQLGSLIFWYTRIHILRQPDVLPHEFLARISAGSR
jgi:hypothetical protein